MKPMPRFLLGLLLGLPIGGVVAMVAEVVSREQVPIVPLWAVSAIAVALACWAFGNWEPRGFAKTMLKAGVIGIPFGWLVAFVVCAIATRADGDKAFAAAIWIGVLIGMPIGAVAGALFGVFVHWLINRSQPQHRSELASVPSHVE